MLAFLLLITLFCTWGFIGYVLLFALWSRRNLLQNMLLAPAVGAALVVILIFSLSRLGIPVKRFGPGVGVALLATSCYLYRKLDVVIPFKHFRLYSLVLLLTLFATGRPIFDFGFDWLSICNDDMSNYVLAAHRFVDYGYFDVLPFRELFQNRDMSSYYWEMHGREGARPGSELMLAWVISCTPWTGHQVFMPIIVALNLCLVSATGAMALQGRKMRKAALLVCLLIGLSAMSTFGMTLQLIGQVFGLTMLISSVTLVMRAVAPIGWARILRWASVAGIQLAALSIVYPEVIPFLALSCTVYFGLQLFRGRLKSKRFVSYITAIAVMISVLLNSYMPAAFEFLRRQTAAGTGKWGSGKFILFPYFLLPSGLAHFWGFISIGVAFKEPGLSIGIFVGGVLLLLSTLAILLQAWRGQPAAMVALVMILVTVTLVRQQADYGLFKIAMFIQPFLLATIVRAWLRLNGENYAEQPITSDV